jgi:hypothetical protein
VGRVCGVVNNLIKYPEKFKQPEQFIGTLGDLYDINQGADPNVVLAKPSRRSTPSEKTPMSLQSRQLASTSESHIIESAMGIIKNLRVDERYGGSTKAVHGYHGNNSSP